jgi:ABC-2 type transport system ATP-binding protein
MLPVLSVKNLTKFYGQKKVVNNLSFSLYPGQIFGFVGPNGAGKSTAIKMITGLATLSGGEVRISGYSINTSFTKAIADIGAVVEMPQLYSYLTGEKNLKLYASFYGKKAFFNGVIMLFFAFGECGCRVFREKVRPTHLLLLPTRGIF